MAKKFLEVLNGRTAEKPPFWFMRQAGRYLPEYRELREKKGGFLAMALDPETAVEITMQPIRRFGMDAAVIFSDILMIPYALGQDLQFVAGEGPKLPPLRTAEDIGKLSYARYEEKLQPVREIVSGVRSTLEAEGFSSAATLGFAGAPWTVACYMVEGGGSKDFLNVKKMAYGDPALFSELMDILVEASAQYLIRQIEAGAEAVQLFDSWAGVLDESQFRRWVIEPTRDLVRIIRDTYPDVPVIGFPRAAGYNYLAYAQDTGVTALGLDSQVPAGWVKRALQPLLPVQGNLDPVCLLAGGDSLKLGVEKVLGDLSGGPFVFNLGHGIHKNTPVEHVEFAVRMVREFCR